MARKTTFIQKFFEGDKASALYSLSIFLKHGEVLHIENLNREQKDNYFRLCKDPKGSILIETEDQVRNILSYDIIKITSQTYTPDYKKYVQPVSKAMLTESLLGSTPFRWVRSLFFLFAIMSSGLVLFELMSDGVLLDILFDLEIQKMFMDGMAETVGKIYGYTIWILVVMHLLDIFLPNGEQYFVNRDGTEEPDVSKVNNLVATIGFIVLLQVIKIGFNMVMNML